MVIFKVSSDRLTLFCKIYAEIMDHASFKNKALNMNRTLNHSNCVIQVYPIIENLKIAPIL